MYNNELYHHGILGQKWGVRRYQNPDGSYKKGAKGRYNDKVSGDKTSIKFEKTSGTAKTTGLSDKQKTALKVAGAAVAAGLAAYGAYKLSQTDVTSVIKDGKVQATNIFGKVKDYPISSISSFKDGSKLAVAYDNKGRSHTATSSQFVRKQADSVRDKLYSNRVGDTIQKVQSSVSNTIDDAKQNAERRRYNRKLDKEYWSKNEFVKKSYK